MSSPDISHRIVICDDEAHITRAVSMKLTRAGFAVEACSHGLDALEAIRRELPALLISDCQMPRMGGIELIRRLRAEPESASLPVILLTAKGFELDEDELRNDLWVSRIICKPFSPRELLQTVQGVLGVGMPTE